MKIKVIIIRLAAGLNVDGIDEEKDREREREGKRKLSFKYKTLILFDNLVMLLPLFVS